MLVAGEVIAVVDSVVREVFPTLPSFPVSSAPAPSPHPASSKSAAAAAVSSNSVSFFFKRPPPFRL